MSTHVTDRLSAYMDRELSVLDAAAVRDHLAACEACAARLAQLAAVDGSFRDLQAEAPPGYFDSFASRARLRIERAPRVPTRFRLPVWSWAVAAAVLVAVVLPRMFDEARAPREPGRAGPGALQGVAVAPSASPSVAERGQTRQADAEARVNPAVARTPTPLLGSTERATAAEDKAPASAPEAALRRSSAAKDEAPRFAGAPPAAPAPQGQNALAEARKLEGGSSESTGAADQTLGAPPPRDEAQAGEPVAPLLKKDQRHEADATALPEAAAAGAGRSEEGKKSRPAAAMTTMAPPLSPVEAEYRALESRTTAASLAELRDGWRAFALRHPQDALADEARVRVIALGIDIARRTGLRSDEAQARKDAADYLARKDAAQKERVRALLDDFSP